MNLIVWLAVNGLRWLVVAAVIAWANPQLPHWHVDAPVYQPPVMQRSIQLAPCPPWAIALGRWGSANVCGQYPNAEARYRHLLKNS